MAVWNPGTGNSLKGLDSFEKVQAYLYKLNEQLQYMFRNLTPEDNNAAQVPSLSYTTNQNVKIIVNGEELDVVLSKEVIKAINESVETALIQAGRISINGIASAGNKFTIGANGAPTITDGAIDSSNITGGTMSGTDISGATATTTDHQTGKVGPFDVASTGISNTNVDLPTNGEATLAELTLKDAFWQNKTVTEICQIMWDELFPSP